MKRGFGSDNHAGALPGVLDAIAAANEGHAESYGHDELSQRVAARVAQEFGDDGRGLLRLQRHRRERRRAPRAVRAVGGRRLRRDRTPQRRRVRRARADRRPEAAHRRRRPTASSRPSWSSRGWSASGTSTPSSRASSRSARAPSSAPSTARRARRAGGAGARARPAAPRRRRAPDERRRGAGHDARRGRAATPTRSRSAARRRGCCSARPSCSSQKDARQGAALPAQAVDAARLEDALPRRPVRCAARPGALARGRRPRQPRWRSGWRRSSRAPSPSPSPSRPTPSSRSSRPRPPSACARTGSSTPGTTRRARCAGCARGTPPRRTSTPSRRRCVPSQGPVAAGDPAAVRGLRQRGPAGARQGLPRRGAHARLRPRAEEGGPAGPVALVPRRLGHRHVPPERLGRRALRGRRRARGSRRDWTSNLRPQATAERLVRLRREHPFRRDVRPDRRRSRPPRPRAHPPARAARRAAAPTGLIAAEREQLVDAADALLFSEPDAPERRDAALDLLDDLVEIGRLEPAAANAAAQALRACGQTALSRLDQLSRRGQPTASVASPRPERSSHGRMSFSALRIARVAGERFSV